MFNTELQTLQTIKYCEWFERPAAGCKTCHYMPLHITHNALFWT